MGFTYFSATEENTVSLDILEFQRLCELTLTQSLPLSSPVILIGHSFPRLVYLLRHTESKYSDNAIMQELSVTDRTPYRCGGSLTRSQPTLSVPIRTI
ncbi:hypothetical protein PoB_002991500 [Plakobranchus ocellatus]|uniref:Uncharacterized protein n=1 Tax=Plakobranchus ocellatus TaxID=259542 RepID=A0AAV4A7Q2_9GAST|nr:hypothetical protein PoB_002991500 [Plakobranchus ocellatus]